MAGRSQFASPSLEIANSAKEVQHDVSTCDNVETRRDLEVQIRADRDIRYQRVVEVMAAAKRAGVVKLGFVTAPGE
ncbi:MAG: biopolymer transporter ExbD [Zoogloeaceae bacterium]|jgi:biopolymer transport protein ExbD|nr:biopolymer transporter ExbD [Zoogloeaceae bacterium]